MAEDENATERLHLRLRPEDKTRIEEAATHEGVTVAAFVRRAALKEARKVKKEMER